MYFLNGSREYVKPRKNSDGIFFQWNDCIDQINGIEPGKQLYIINFFFDAGNKDKNLVLKNEIEKKIKLTIETPLVLNFVYQQPIGSEIIAEILTFDPSIWNCELLSISEGSAMCFCSGNSKILIGNVIGSQVDDCTVNSEIAFRSVQDLLNKKGLEIGDIVRQWNYIGNILSEKNGGQFYQKFNNVRSRYYEGKFADGYPAATGIGMNCEGTLIEFVAVKSTEMKSFPVENPDQIAAHKYSKEVLVSKTLNSATTPKFERARYFEINDLKMIFISGTASILGENSVEINCPSSQTDVTIRNIQRLYSPEILQGLNAQKLLPVYGHARVYIKNRKDFPAIKKQFRKHYGNLPVVYLIADVCREELLVEIEGTVILQ